MVKLTIRMSVGETFEVVTDSPAASVLMVKELIMIQKSCPIWSQRLICNGKELVNESTVEENGLHENSTIHLLIRETYLSKMHPLELLDPISGQLLCNPVTASDGNVYSESSIQKWKDSFNGARIISPLTSKNSKLDCVPNDEMRKKVEEYVKCLSFQDDDITNIDELGIVFSIIDHIRDDLAEVLHDWKVPQVVVVGNESIGKSTLLERLAMMPLFPRGERRCTRMKIEIRLRRGPTKNPRLTLYRYDANGDVAEKSTEVAMETGSEGLQIEMDSLINSDPSMPQICPDKYLVMEITNPKAPNIDLVDMPGLIATPEHEANLIQKMITDHFQVNGEYSMYLFVLEATRNVNQSPIALVKDRPEMEQNTLGVITHLDKVDPKVDVDRLGSLKSLANGNNAPGIGGVSLKPHGFLLTMNATKDEDAESGFQPVFQRAAREDDFFRSIGFGELIENKRAGCSALIARLKLMYWNYLEKQWLPKTFSKIEYEIENWKRQDAELGLPRAHIILSDQKREELYDAVVKGIKEIFRNNLVAIELMYEDECLAPLHEKIVKAVQPSSMQRIQIKGHIAKMRNSLIEMSGSYLSTEKSYWVTELEKILKEDASSLKLARFDCLIDAFKAVFEEKLDAANVATMIKLETYLDFHLTELNSMLFETNNESKLVSVSVAYNVAETIRHIMSSNLHIFDTTMLDDQFIKSTLSDVSMIENCSTERFNALNKLELLSIAKKGLEDLAAELQTDNNSKSSTTTA